MFFRLWLKDKRSHHRRKRQSEQERASEGETIGEGHRPKNLSLNARHRKQRDEGCNDDRGGKEDWFTYFLRSQNGCSSYVMAIGIWLGQMTIDVLDHYDGCIHNDSEIDRSH